MYTPSVSPGAVPLSGGWRHYVWLVPLSGAGVWQLVPLWGECRVCTPRPFRRARFHNLVAGATIWWLYLVPGSTIWRLYLVAGSTIWGLWRLVPSVGFVYRARDAWARLHYLVVGTNIWWLYLAAGSTIWWLYLVAGSTIWWLWYLFQVQV